MQLNPHQRTPPNSERWKHATKRVLIRIYVWTNADKIQSLCTMMAIIFLLADTCYYRDSTQVCICHGDGGCGRWVFAVRRSRLECVATWDEHNEHCRSSVLNGLLKQQQQKKKI